MGSSVVPGTRPPSLSLVPLGFSFFGTSQYHVLAVNWLSGIPCVQLAVQAAETSVADACTSVCVLAKPEGFTVHLLSGLSVMFCRFHGCKRQCVCQFFVAIHVVIQHVSSLSSSERMTGTVKCSGDGVINCSSTLPTLFQVARGLHRANPTSQGSKTSEAERLALVKLNVTMLVISRIRSIKNSPMCTSVP